MRIELGPLKVELEKDEDPAVFFRGMFRRIGNEELSGILGVTPRTVQRWRRDGLLPRGGRPMLMDVLGLFEQGKSEGRRESRYGKDPHPGTAATEKGMKSFTEVGSDAWDQP